MGSGTRRLTPLTIAPAGRVKAGGVKPPGYGNQPRAATPPGEQTMTHTTTKRLQDKMLRHTMEYSNEQLEALSREIAGERIERERAATGRLPQHALTYSGYVIRVTPTGAFLNVRGGRQLR